MTRRTVPRWFLPLSLLALAAAGFSLTRPSGGPIGAVLVTLVRPQEALQGVPATGGRRLLGLMKSDGRTRILTDGFDGTSSPAISHDARRVVFAGRRNGDASPALWEMRWDGSDLRLITRGRGAPDHPVHLPDGRILFSDDARDEARAGAGAAGPRALYSCAPDGSDLRRLTFGSGVDAEPAVLSDGRVRFLRRADPGAQGSGATPLVMHPDGTGLTALEGTPGAGGASAAGPAGAVAAAGASGPAGYAVVGSIPVAPRPVPPVLTSVVDPSRATGTLLCLDVRASRIPAIAARPRGSITRVRVALARGAGSGGRADAAGAPEEVLGEAPVEADGSFFVQVPADTPLRLTLIGTEGEPVGSFDRGLWVRPNENRGCIGCHEEADRAPENRRPLAVLREPTALAGGRGPTTLAGGRGGEADGAR